MGLFPQTAKLQENHTCSLKFVSKYARIVRANYVSVPLLADSVYALSSVDNDGKNLNIRLQQTEHGA